MGKYEWGIYKITWDLRYHLEDGKGEFIGPLVAPGEYTVIMKFDEQVLQQTFEFEIDPELALSGTSVDDLIEQEELSLKVAYLVLEIRKEIRKL